MTLNTHLPQVIHHQLPALSAKQQKLVRRVRLYAHAVTAAAIWIFGRVHRHPAWFIGADASQNECVIQERVQRRAAKEEHRVLVRQEAHLKACNKRERERDRERECDQ